MKGRDELGAICGILDHERGFLEGLTAILPEGARVINIGALGGCSTVAMLRGGRDIKDFHLWSIDIEPRPGEMTYVKECGLADPRRFTQICGDSKVVGLTWTDYVDLVFIDGDHTYEGCKGDIDAWARLIANGGYLVCHDYESYMETVTQAVNEWFEEAKKHGWIRVAKVDISVAFKRGSPGSLLAQWLEAHPNTVTGKFMRGVT